MKSQIPIAAKPLAIAPNGSLPPGVNLVPIAVASINPAGQQTGQQAAGAAIAPAGMKPNAGKTGKTTKAEAKAAAAAAAQQQQQAANSSHMMNGSMHNHHHNHQPVNNGSNNVNDPIASQQLFKQQQQQQQGFMQPGQQQAFLHFLPIATNMVTYSDIKLNYNYWNWVIKIN